MVMVVPTAASADSLSQILYVGQLAARRGVRKIAGELGKLIRCPGIAARLGSLGGARQVGSDLLRDLRILGRIRLLKLLKRAGQLCEFRKLAAIWLLGG